MAKRCSICLKTKNKECFYMRSDHPHLLQSHCKSCILGHRKKYRIGNIEKIKQKDIGYHSKNRVKRNAYLKTWQQSHLKTRATYQRLKRKTDINFALKSRMHTRIKAAIKRNSKNSSARELLGCSIYEFRGYFESKFKSNMSWDKFLIGEIHIDHIVPCARFDLSKHEDQRKCFHYTNLQPLFAKDNILKRDKLETCHR